MGHGDQRGCCLRLQFLSPPASPLLSLPRLALLAHPRLELHPFSLGTPHTHDLHGHPTLRCPQPVCRPDPLVHLHGLLHELILDVENQRRGPFWQTTVHVTDSRCRKPAHWPTTVHAMAFPAWLLHATISPGPRAGGILQQETGYFRAVRAFSILLCFKVTCCCKEGLCCFQTRVRCTAQRDTLMVRDIKSSGFATRIGGLVPFWELIQETSLLWGREQEKGTCWRVGSGPRGRSSCRVRGL